MRYSFIEKTVPIFIVAQYYFLNDYYKRQMTRGICYCIISWCGNLQSIWPNWLTKLTDRLSDRLYQLTDLTKCHRRRRRRRHPTPTQCIPFCYSILFAISSIFAVMLHVPSKFCKWARMKCWAFQYVLNLYCVIILCSFSLILCCHRSWNPSVRVKCVPTDSYKEWLRFKVSNRF